jgi:hypothetical protein
MMFKKYVRVGDARGRIRSEAYLVFMFFYLEMARSGLLAKSWRRRMTLGKKIFSCWSQRY